MTANIGLAQRCKMPVAIGRAGRNPHHFGCFTIGQADEVAQLDEFRLLWMPSGKRIKDIIHGQHIVRHVSCNGALIHPDSVSSLIRRAEKAIAKSASLKKGAN